VVKVEVGVTAVTAVATAMVEAMAEAATAMAAAAAMAAVPAMQAAAMPAAVTARQHTVWATPRPHPRTKHHLRPRFRRWLSNR